MVTLVLLLFLLEAMGFGGDKSSDEFCLPSSKR